MSLTIPKGRVLFCTGVAVGLLFFTTTRESAAQGLAGFWQFEDANDLGKDSASAGNGLEVEGGVEFEPNGKIGGAISLNGEDGMLVDPDDFPDGLPTGDDEYTISLWMKPNSPVNPVGGPSGMIGWGAYGSGSSVNAFRIFGDNGFRHYWWGNDLDAQDFDVEDLDVDLDDGEWHHAAATYDGSTRALFLDGQLLVEDEPNPNNAQPEQFAIGRTAPQFNEFFDGLLDEVAVFDVGLSEAQIVAVMNGDYSEFGINDDPLAPLEDGSLTDPQERADYIHDVLNTWVGDSNLDGEFNSSDFVAVFTGGKFETGDPATWSEGDWNGDGEFSSGDFVAAFTDGGFELGPRPALATVPEPSPFVLVLFAASGLVRRFRRTH